MKLRDLIDAVLVITIVVLSIAYIRKPEPVHSASQSPSPAALPSSELARIPERPVVDQSPEVISKEPEQPQHRKLADLLSPKDEAYITAIEASILATIDHNYVDLFRRIRLDPAKAKKLRAALAAKKNLGLTVQTIMTNYSDESKREREIQPLTGMVYRDVEAEIQSILSEKEYEMYKSYEQYIGIQEPVRSISDRLSYLGTPLNDDQNTAFLAVYDQFSRHVSTVVRPDPIAPASAFEAYYQAILNQHEQLDKACASFLSKTQQQNLKDYLAEQIAPTELMLERAKKKL